MEAQLNSGRSHDIKALHESNELSLGTYNRQIFLENFKNLSYVKITKCRIK